MRQSQNRKVNRAGRIGCLGLLALAFLLVNPVTGLEARAIEGKNKENSSANSQNYEDEEIMPASTPSAVNISFSSTSGSASLTPTSTSGASALISIKATVGVQNSGGYTVYLGSTSSSLTGKITSQTIPALSTPASYNNLPVNSWGYNATEATTVPTNPKIHAMPTNTRGTIISSNDSTNIPSDSKTFMLSFAANIGPDKPADTYENQVTLSVISSPLEITGLSSISNMQEMTAAICSASEIGETQQLHDTRDGSIYSVAKLKDGKCWMTQNLRIINKTITPTDSDVSSGYTIPSSSISGFSNNTAQNVYYSNNQIYGAYYSWCAATAGTCTTAGTAGDAPSSICPKGWRLPTGNTSGDYYGLLNGLTNTNAMEEPYNFSPAGAAASGSTTNVGSWGYYWTSTSRNSANAWAMYFNSGTLEPGTSTGSAKYSGYSVRCIAR